MKKRCLTFGLVITGFMLNMQYACMAAEGDWSVKTDVQGIYGNYSGSANRSSIAGGGLILSADYLEQGGFSLGGNYTRLKFNTMNDINQQALYGSLHYNLYFDAIPGPLTLRIDGHSIYNNDITGDTDHVKVIAPQFSFMNYAKTLYVDFGYAYSKYLNNLEVHQFTPTFGFAFNDSSDWIQLRGYFIDPSNSLRAQSKNNTTAVEAKWMHWFDPGAWHRLEKLQVSGLAGERIYAVDGDAAVVYNLADIQRGSLSLGLQWRLAESFRLLMVGGNENYLNNNIGDSYDNRFLYLNISKQW
ncbi:MAG: hypothetical protein ACE5DY_00190 [Mariprofundaceae bacterium]